MPFVEVLWKPEQLDEPALVRLCDALPMIVATVMQKYDPDHVVLPSMVDLRVGLVGPHDRISPALYITVLARTEPLRDRNRLAIVGRITTDVQRRGAPPDTLVELVLTNRVSLYEYDEGGDDV